MMIQPEGVQNLDGFDRVEAYQGSYADCTVFVKAPVYLQELRVHYLKELREDWHYIGKYKDEEHDVAYAHFKRKQ